LNKIDLELDEKRPVIVWVDGNPNEAGNQQHFIVIIGKDEQGAYFALDPWYNEDAIYFHARYGDPKVGILGLRLITGPVPIPEAEKPDVAGMQSEIEQYKLHIQDVKDHLKVLQGEDFPKVIGRIDELMTKEKEFKDHIEKDKAEEEKPIEPAPDGVLEEYQGRIKLLNMIIKFYIERK
jgi:hypothetical protein